MTTQETQYNVLDSEAYLVYLRKSRADDPRESVEEVLAKHETMLQELAERELGGRIPEDCIFREVVSGETIDERPEVKKMLARLENPAVKMVLAVDPARLSRGDLEDCGKMVNALRYSGTKVMTLTMTYDLTNKMHRKFFEQELMRGNDFLEYTKEILLRGRILSVQKGNYIGNIPPFGYDKATIDGEPSLKPNDEADVVRLVFELFVNEGYNYLQIARKLDSLGVKPMHSEIWEKSSIRAMIKNVHYAGFVIFGKKKSEKVYKNGELVLMRNTPTDEEDVIIAPGRHQAIIPQEMFDRAQAMIQNNPRGKYDTKLKNPLAGLLVCAKCGKMMVQHPYPHAATRVECRNRNGCGAKSVRMDEVVDAVVYALENEHLPHLYAKLQSDAGNARNIQQKQLEKMAAELTELHAQEAKQYEFLEKGIYTEDKFLERNKLIHAEMDALKRRIYEAKQNMPKQIDYSKKIVTLKNAITAMRDDNVSIEAKNKMLKTIVKRIEYVYISWEGRGKINYKLHIELLV